jgi:FkbM family methyltransferase
MLLVRPCVRVPGRTDKPLVLYGAGNLGRLAWKFFAHVKRPVAYVVDHDPGPRRREPFWAGTAVVAPADVPRADRKSCLLAVSVCTTPYSDLHEMLTGQGWEDVVPFYDLAQAYRDEHPLNNGWFVDALREPDVRGIEKVLSSWDDDVSRAHHLQFLAWRCLREDWVFGGAPVTTGDRYFIPEVLSVLHDHESFLDLGAHHGEVTGRFLDSVNHRFRAAWLVEADAVNLPELRAHLDLKLAGADSDRITVLPRAVGETCGRRRFFTGLGYLSQPSDLGQTEIDVTTIDELRVGPTLVKVHLEGHELDALKGALRTLLHDRPIVAATTYHNDLGLWRLPAWLMDHLPDYRFLLRLHSWCGTGSVMYALPHERAGF